MKILIIFDREEFEGGSRQKYSGNDNEQEFRSLISYLQHR